MKSFERHALVAIIVFLTFSKAEAQIFRFIQNPYQAEYYVFETRDSASANYYVFKAKSPAEAIKDGVWCITEDPLAFRGKAILLHRVKSPASADLVVYYVRSSENAGNARNRKVALKP
jgi:hypothetical protein